ncbi:zinc finger protein 654 [Mixophyes fleayi]|uniref:zinc finger protein 654 n=1 Tax=Mixophyes fleayi TaxID=3061075 RepID=UPI003F4DB187
MAEDESDQESERLVEELEAVAEDELKGLDVGVLSNQEYCRRFCEVVEEYTARWQVPLPQLQVLQTALCCFTSASVSFQAESEHVQYVLSRLALSLFELLLFFGKDEFYEAPLKDILGAVQECHDLLIQYDNTDLRLVTCVIKDGGPWEHLVLQAILKGKSEPQDIVDKYLRSENPLFFELRVRYLIACERISEAVALITTCLSHSEVGKNLYYHQAYFTCLYMTRLTDKLLSEHVLRIDCGDGVKIICDIEKEGKTALALQLSEAFLITQLQTGNMYCAWDLIFIWSKLQLKVNPSKQAFVEQCYNMLRIAVNVKVIFPFMKIIQEEIGEVGVQLSVELCGCALQLDLHDNPETKSLIYKTIAYLLPTDLEICRICALSVFFLERTIEFYKDVERLYKYSDEDYNEFTSCVENRVRFELLPILKRGLVFDPEFWSFEMIQTNCVALLDEKAAVALIDSKAPDVVEQSLPLDVLLGDEPAVVLPDPKMPDVVEQSLPLDAPGMQLRNGVLKHKEISSRLRVSPNAKKNHTMLSPYKMEHINVPRHLCTLCNREFLGGHIFRHAQTHQERGCFSCVICARKFRNRINMLRHLKHHLKIMQRHPIPSPPAGSQSNPFHLLLDTNDVNSSEASYLSLENGNSSSSTNEILSAVHIPCQESAPDIIIPDENHMVELNAANLNHSTATQTSFSTDVSNSDDTAAIGEMEEVKDASSRNLTECVKLNGSLLSREDPLVNSQISHPCPAQGCHRVFQRVRALNKHARNAHPCDVKVQQHLMAWNKGKCRFCQRKFLDCRHFIHHLKRHFYPNVYFCQQLNCNKRFKLATQLTEHQLSHESFKAPCGFLNCPEVFEQISSLYEHEALHYEQNPLEIGTPLLDMEPIETVPVTSVPEEDITIEDMSAPSSKKVKPVQEEEAIDLPVPIWKSRKDVAEPKTYKQMEKIKNNGDSSCNVSEVNVRQDPVQEMPPTVVEEQIVNGYSVQEQPVVETSGNVDDTTGNVDDTTGNVDDTTGNVDDTTGNVDDTTGNVDDTTGNVDQTTATDTNNTLGLVTAQEVLLIGTATEDTQTPSKPNLTACTSDYGSVGKTAYSRPLPPSYLAEQYISMPKRRKKYQGYTAENHMVSKTSVDTFRCGKCLKNYCSSEALEEHLAQKKCQLNFGFDSDDENAW